MTTRPHLPRPAVALGIAIGFVILACAAKLLWDLRSDAWAAAVRGGTDVAASVAHDLDRNFQVYNLSLQSIVDDLRIPGVLELPVDLRDKMMFDRSSTAPYLGAILVLDVHGNVFIDSRSRIPRRKDFAKREFYRYHKAHGDDRLHIGAPFVDDADGTTRITMSRRLEFADGAFAGVVVGTIEVAYFRDLFSTVDLGEHSGLTLTLDDGTMLVRFPYREGDVGRNVGGTDVFERIRREETGNFVARSSIDGVQRQYSFRRVGEFPIYLTVAQAAGTITRGWLARAWMVSLLTAFLLAGCVGLATILHRELRHRGRVEARLSEERERLHVTLGSIGDAVVTTDVGGTIVYLNPVAERMTGWTTAEALGRSSCDVLTITAGDSAERVQDGAERVLGFASAAAGPAESVLHRRGGGQFPVQDTAAPIRDDDGAVIGAVLVFHDVSESHAMARRMSYLAQHDALTDLPNRLLLHDRLAQAIDRSHRSGTQVAVLFIDIDRFKTVNDSLGHSGGDQLLVAMAARLVACVRESDTVSRQGGDEFVLLLPDLPDDHGASRVADKILEEIALPVALDGRTLTVTASIGIAIYPGDGIDVRELTKAADAAMYLAKQSGRNAYRYFTSELGSIASKRLNFEHQIAEGLRNGEFVLHYQPQCRAADGAWLGAEALVRWNHGGRMIPPCDFIPVAEECGQIIGLGDAILSMACRQAVEWNRDRDEPFVVAVNVSAHQFRAPGFVERVRQTLRETGLAPRCLELEITETALMTAVERTEVILEALKDLGVQIALDDFGTGYSSLSYLQRFPVDRIKIDKGFVHQIESSRSDAAIVQAMIDLGRTLGLAVIAEGVETLAQSHILMSMGCEQVQGFLFGRPCLPAEFERVRVEASPLAA